MNPSEKPFSGSGSHIEAERNVVHQFFSNALPDISLVVEASNLAEKDKQTVRNFYKEFLAHLEDESYIERMMVSTGPLIPRRGEDYPLRRIKLKDGSYSIENSLHVFWESSHQEITNKSPEMRAVRSAINSILEESFHKQNHP